VNPYKDNNDPEMEVKFAEMINMAEAEDEFYSLKKAKDSLDWLK